jgi:hypothetical protein
VRIAITFIGVKITLRVEITLCNLHVEITLMRVAITLVRVKITLRVEITLRVGITLFV